RFQWTRLAHGVPSPQFVEQIKHLLEAPRKAAAAPRATIAPASSLQSRSVIPPWAWAAAVVLIGGLAAFFAVRPTTREPVPPAAPAKSAAAPVSEARQL